MILYKKLLIIDDDVEDQEIFIDAVSRVDTGIQCRTFTNGEEALARFVSHADELPEIIFLDINMPRVNGKQILKAIKKEASLSHIPVIMYSTTLGQRDIDEVKKLGAAHYLFKPTRFDELCRSLANILSKDW
ncbi:MAG: response regulator [Bacteroidota bacterium]